LREWINGDLISKYIASKIEVEGDGFFNKKVVEINYSDLLDIDQEEASFVLASEEIFTVNFQQIFRANQERLNIGKQPNFLASPIHSIIDLEDSEVELIFSNYPNPKNSELNRPDEISSKNLGKVLYLQMELINKSEIKPQIVTAIYVCQSCGHSQPCAQELWSVGSLNQPKECAEIDGGCGRPKSKTIFLLHREESTIVDYILCDVNLEEEEVYRKLLVTSSRYFDSLIVGNTINAKCIVDLNLGSKHQYTLHLSQLFVDLAETALQSGRKAIARKRERIILEIVRRIHAETGEIVSLNDVLTEAGRSDINRDSAEDLIDLLCRDGRLMRPGGYETLQPV